MNILAFDTSTDTLGIAIKSDKGIYSFSFSEALKHSEKLLPLTEWLLASASLRIEELSLVVCAKGPGSFTGLRIGMATAKGIAFALSVPLVSVPTLDFMASGFNFFNGAVLPVIDAKKNRFYTAMYTQGIRKSDYVDAESSDIIDLIYSYDKILLTGPDSSKLYNEIAPEVIKIGKSVMIDPCSKNSRIISCLETGIDLYQKGITDPDCSGPVYIRKSDAEEHSAAEK